MKARIVKRSLTQKQREHIARYGHCTENSILIVSKGDGLPGRSWWITAERENFSERARQEAERMRLSSIGSAKGRPLSDEG